MPIGELLLFVSHLSFNASLRYSRPLRIHRWELALRHGTRLNFRWCNLSVRFPNIIWLVQIVYLVALLTNLWEPVMAQRCSTFCSDSRLWLWAGKFINWNSIHVVNISKCLTWRGDIKWLSVNLSSFLWSQFSSLLWWLCRIILTTAILLLSGNTFLILLNNRARFLLGWHRWLVFSFCVFTITLPIKWRRYLWRRTFQHDIITKGLLMVSNLCLEEFWFVNLLDFFARFNGSLGLLVLVHYFWDSNFWRVIGISISIRKWEVSWWDIVLGHIEGLDIICDLVVIVLLLDAFDVSSWLFPDTCRLLLLFNIVLHFGWVLTDSGGIVVTNSSHAWT